jgi:hypothetical protein
MTKPDFGGYATKNDIVCTDGRTIRRDAFKHDNGKVVPLVWMHNSSDPANILGHAELENRPDGVYANCYFNNSPNAENAKNLVIHKAIKALSIYANKLGQVGKDVRSGVIREVSLVMGGANPGALIDTVSFSHGDFEDETIDEAIITSGEEFELTHSDESEAPVVVPEVEVPVVETPAVEVPVVEEVVAEEKKVEELEHAEGDKTVGDVLATLNDEQKAAVGFLIEELTVEAEDAQHSDEEDTSMVKKNVFDKEGEDQNDTRTTLTHADFKAIVETAKRSGGSLKEAFLAHVEENDIDLSHAGGTDAGYGIENLGFLFPEARNVSQYPTMTQRNMGWVTKVMSGTRHTPFSRIKTVHADITADEARAKGYVTGNRKMEEVFTLLKRTTSPTTIYKKQKLDRDDMVDITDMDIVAWLKAEMRVLLDEEIARAILLGDGRSSTSEDKISETNIRPIAFDDDLYTVPVEISASADDPDDCIEAIIRARSQYKGSGSPSLFVSEHVLADWLLIKDTLGYRIYKTKAELEAALNVSEIVAVEIMTESTSYDGGTHELYAILVNLNDYTIGADKGGEINMFDDFDIDYNQYKYLMETRISGALTVPHSALVFITDTSGGAMG